MHPLSLYKQLTRADNNAIAYIFSLQIWVADSYFLSVLNESKKNKRKDVTICQA